MIIRYFENNTEVVDDTTRYRKETIEYLYSLGYTPEVIAETLGFRTKDIKYVLKIKD